MFNMEEEVENLPSSKPSAEADAEETSEKPDLSDEQKQKLSEALSILSALSEECG